jgi:pseudouridine synthase
MERLQKVLSRAGVASRRASEQLILDGRVSVNGSTVLTLGTKVDVTRDDVRVDGQPVRADARRRYLLLNKPRGYVTTRSDPQRRPTVLDLLQGVREYVYPVGRLDFGSEGLLLLTNDGDLASRLMHPRHEIAREYVATVLGIPDEHDLRRLARGVVIDDVRTRPATVQVLDRPRVAERTGSGKRRSDRATIRIIIREGRNRQVRRMCEAVGHPVERLKRVAIGPIRDSRLKPGQWRDLTAPELARLREASEAERGPGRGRQTRGRC